jgi:hypothetical protein
MRHGGKEMSGHRRLLAKRFTQRRAQEREGSARLDAGADDAHLFRKDDGKGVGRDPACLEEARRLVIGTARQSSADARLCS